MTMANRLITFVLCPQMLATSVSLPMELLQAAQSIAAAARRRKRTKLEFQLASLDGKPVATHTGISLTPDCTVTAIEQSHITYLPALWRNPEATLRRHAPMGAWLADQFARGHTIAGVGTGCCFMAEAALLDYKPATTHWYYFDEFAKKYPRVDLKRHAFITQANTLFCTGSVTSLADLTVFFIEELFDAQTARAVERHFFHEVRQAYQLKHHSKEEAYGHTDEIIAEAQTWLSDNAQKDVTVRELAHNLQMSLRTFNRRFKNATQQTPLQYLQKIRMRIAGELLQTTNLSIAEVAFKTGYQDVAHFAALFRKHFGTTPGQYRTTVRAKLFHVS